MNFITNTDTFTGPAYSPVVFYVVLVLGIGLVIFRPYNAFLFAVFCLAAKNLHYGVMTRPTPLGPLLNFNDLLLWIAVLACFGDIVKSRRKIWFPDVALLILFVVFVGFVRSGHCQGYTYLIFRKTWAAAIFPVMLLVGANMVTGSDRAKKFFVALFLGCTVAALLQIMDVIGLAQQIRSPSIGYYHIRTISYIYSGGPYLLIGLIFAPRDIKIKGAKKYAYYSALALVLLGILLSFTKSLWIQMVACTIVMGLFFRDKIRLSKTLFHAGAVVFCLVIVAGIFLPSHLDPWEMVGERLREISNQEYLYNSYSSRLSGQKEEIDLWWRGNVLLGHGSAIPVEYYAQKTSAALGHVGYAIYLTHYGLIGFVLYLIVLPSISILRGKRYCHQSAESYGKTVVMVGIACIISGVLGCLTSSHYLLATTHIPGLLIGAVQGLWRSESQQDSNHSSTHKLTVSRIFS